MNREIETGIKARFFYGWWIVLAGFFIVAYGAGAGGYTTHNLYSLMSGTTSQAAIALSIFGIVGVIAFLAIGPFIDRFGPRKLMLIGISVASIALLGLSFVNSLLYILLGMLAIGMSAGFLLPVQTATANWFMKRRSIALAVICAAPALGGPVANLLGDQITDKFSLQGALLGLGVVMLVIGIPLALVIRHKPEQHGYVPDGSTPIIKETVQPLINNDANIEEVNLSLRQALRTKAFWILVVAMSLVNGSSLLVRNQRMIYLPEQGLDSKISANFSELTTLMGLAGILLFGFLGDKFSKRYLLAIAVALQSLSIVILMTAGNIPQLYLYMLINGFGAGTVPLILAIRADYFGRKAFATITVVMGFFGAILSVGFVFLDWVIFVLPGNYQTTFLVSMLFGFLAAVVFLFAKPPGLPHQELPDNKTT